MGTNPYGSAPGASGSFTLSAVPRDWVWATGFGAGFSPLIPGGTATIGGGVSGSGAVLNGGFLQAPANAFAGDSAMTLSMWVNINSDRAYARLFDFGSDTNRWIAAINSGPGSTSFLFSDGGTSEQVTFPSLSAGTWHHVAITMDSTNAVRIYVDGSQAGSGQLTHRMSDFGASTNDWFGKSEFADPLLDGSYDTVFFLQPGAIRVRN